MRTTSCFLLLVLFATGVTRGQSGAGTDPSCMALLEQASKLGPSTIVPSEGGQWLVYEDRVSRQPLRASMRYSHEWSTLLSECGVLGIRPQRFGLSLPAFSSDGEVFPAGQLPGVARSISGPFIDLELELLYNFAIDYKDDWFRDRIAVAPKLKVWWPNGLMLSAQYAIPIRNQVPEKHAQYWSKPYPNVLMAGFRKQVATNWIGAISAGFYERNRYGSDIQLYWMSDRWPIVLGGRVGMTGYWSYFEGNFEAGPVKQFLGYLDATVYLPWYNLRIRGRNGHFGQEINQVGRPGEDITIRTGTSGEVTRMFGETEIGLHLFYDGFVAYPGFRFSAPLSPKKGMKRGRVAAYPTRQVSVPYDLGRVVRGRNTGFVRPKRGELHRTDIDIWDDLRFLSPNMISNFKR